jgi:AraC-like DNA-binding protein
MAREIEKLIEYRTAHYSAASEASTYFTNQRASVSFQFDNPIICRMMTGYKVMQVDGSAPFPFLPAESILLPPRKSLMIDFPFTDLDHPALCMCIEIDSGKVNSIIDRINDFRRRAGIRKDVSLNWNSFALYRADSAIDAQLDRLMDLYVNENSEFRDALIDANLGELVVRLLQSQAKDLLIEIRSNVPDTGLDTVALMLAHELENRLDLDQLARAAGMSMPTFFRHFRAKFGTTPAKFANQARIRRAQALLRDTQTSVTQVAFEVGFKCVSHFARVFKQATGETPGDYIRRTNLLTPGAVDTFRPEIDTTMQD